jgi:tRNA (mo5U34)-methyltransferase
LRSKVEDLDIDVMELSPERVGTWDVVLFLGVLYHLKDPLAGLERVASVTKRLLIVETVVDLVGLSQPAMAFYPERQLDSDPTNWWGPNHAAVVAMLRATGFETVDVKEPPKSLAYRTARAAYHAIKGRNQFRLAIRRDRAVFHARK